MSWLAASTQQWRMAIGCVGVGDPITNGGLWEFAWMTYRSPELVWVLRAASPTSWGLQCPDPAKSRRTTNGRGGESRLTRVVLKSGESQESLLRRFRKQVTRDRILSDVKKKRFFVSKSEKRRRARLKAIRRERQRQRRKQRRYRR